MSKNHTIKLILGLSCLIVSGCGQKGDLFLAPEIGSQTKTQPQPELEQKPESPSQDAQILIESAPAKDSQDKQEQRS